MDKKEMEEKLYDFFRNENKLDILRNQISILKKQIESINEDLKNCNVSIDVPYYSAGFDEKVQSSRSYTGEAEREVMRETEKMLSRIRNKKFEIENLKELIEVIEIDIMKFNKIFKFLSEDELKLIHALNQINDAKSVKVMWNYHGVKFENKMEIEKIRLKMNNCNDFYHEWDFPTSRQGENIINSLKQTLLSEKQIRVKTEHISAIYYRGKEIFSK